MSQRIASRDNERVKHARKLAVSAAYRAQEGLFFAEGRRLCLDFAAKSAPQTVFCTQKLLETCPLAEQLAPQTFIISEPVAEKLSQTRSTQGLFCVFKTPRAEFFDMALQEGILLLEDVQDPANVGAMLRSAAAFGFGGVVLTPGCADAFSPKALRASMGSALRVPVVCGLALHEAADMLHKAGVVLYAAALENATPLGQTPVRRPFALLVGNEGAGLTKQALALADAGVYIPMSGGVESLNAAVAASVLMFHFSDRRAGFATDKAEGNTHG